MKFYSLHESADGQGLIIIIDGQHHRLSVNSFTRVEFAPLSRRIVSGDVAERPGSTGYSFTHPRGSFHLNFDGPMAYATAGIKGSSPMTSGPLEGQTGETAEERIRSFLLRES